MLLLLAADGETALPQKEISALLNLAPAIEFGADRRVIRSSPVEITWPDFWAQFAFTAKRQQQADSLLAWLREASTVVRISEVWVGGSFVSDKPDPADVDALLFFHYLNPAMPPAARAALFAMRNDVFDSEVSKRIFGVDGACVALSLPPEALIRYVAYWSMVYSNSPEATRCAFYTINSTSLPLLSDSSGSEASTGP
jgi:hypothetical protein